jgi:hypothetical protein
MDIKFIIGYPCLVKAELLNNKRQALTEDAHGKLTLWDIIRCVPLKDYVNSSFIDVYQSLVTKDEWVGNWCSLDIKTGLLTIHLHETTCFDAEVYLDRLSMGIEPENEDQRGIILTHVFLKISSHALCVVNLAYWVLTYLFLGYLQNLKVGNGATTEAPAPSMVKSPSASISEAHSPNPSHQDSPVLKSQPVYMPQSLSIPTDSLTQPTQPSPAVVPIIIESAASDALKKEDFSFLNFDESPWITIPESTHIALSVQESPDAAAFLDLFDATAGQLFIDAGTRESLSEVIPGWLYEWILQVRFLLRKCIHV